MDQPGIEIIHPEPADDYRPRTPAHDGFEQRSPRRSNQRIDEDLSRDFQRFNLGEKKDKNKVRRNSVVIESGKMMRRRSSSEGKRNPRYFELYRFEKSGEDWTVADRIRIKVPQDELEKRVKKGKSRFSIIDIMSNMPPKRRGQINRLVDQKNDAETDREAEWVPVVIEKQKQSGRSILVMDVIIAKSFKSGRPASREKRTSFVGERSDLREPLRSKSKDNSRGKDRSKEKKGNDHDPDRHQDPDFFGEERFFANDGRLIENRGGPFEGPKVDRRPIPLEDPIAGPPPGLQPPRLPPGGWNDPFPPGGGFPHDPHSNQGPIEVINDNFQPSGGPAGNGVLDLDQLLEKPGGGGGGGGGQGHQNFNDPHINDFGGGAPPGDFRPMGPPDRPRLGSRRKSGSRPRPKRIYTDQGPRQYREHRRRYQYGDSSNDGEDEVVSVFFDPDDRSSVSSFNEDHERFIERRGSLKRRPSGRRGGEALYREHHRRGASFNLGRRDMIIEPGRTPRRLEPERRQTIAYIEPRQITYPYRGGGGGRDGRDVIDEPLSPVLTQRSYSPGLLGGGSRRDSRGPALPEMLYPDEVREKDRRAENYMDAIEREARYRDEDLRRQERELDEREARRRGGKAGYREYRPERYF